MIAIGLKISVCLFLIVNLQMSLISMGRLDESERYRSVKASSSGKLISNLISSLIDQAAENRLNRLILDNDLNESDNQDNYNFVIFFCHLILLNFPNFKFILYYVSNLITRALNFLSYKCIFRVLMDSNQSLWDLKF